VYNFGAPDTETGGVLSRLVPAAGGSFYLLSSSGYGVLERVQAPAPPGGLWTAGTLYIFPFLSTPDSLTAGPNGVFYVTMSNTPGGLGSVVQLTPPAAPGGRWTETLLYRFQSGGDDAGNPNSLTLAGDGTLYGTTYGFDLDGDIGRGTVFQLTPPPSPGGHWSYTALRDFEDFHPDVPLILRNGNLYGAFESNYGSAYGGAVFELQPPSTPGGKWTLTYLHQFTGGQSPFGNLVMDEAGTIFGTTISTAEPYTGTVFAITTK